METMRSKLLILLILITFSASAQKSIFWLNRPSDNTVKWNATSGTADGSIRYSYNGLNWFVGYDKSIFGVDARKIAWNGKMWMAVMYSGYLMYSIDGINWINDYESASNLTDITWDAYNEKWMAVGLSGLGNYLYQSLDGINWMSDEITSDYTVENIISVGDRYISYLNANSEIMYSNDGINWLTNDVQDQLLSYPTIQITKISWNGDRVIASGKYGTSPYRPIILTSTDGVHYSAAYAPVDNSTNINNNFQLFSKAYASLITEVDGNNTWSTLASENSIDWASAYPFTCYIGEYYNDYSLVASKFSSSSNSILGKTYDNVNVVNSDYPITSITSIQPRTVHQYLEMVKECPQNIISLDAIGVDYLWIRVSWVTDGGSDIIEKGLCWSTSPNPTLSNDHNSDGVNSNYYVSIATPLQANTTYYVRAYATNATCTAYSNEISVLTYTSSAAVVATVRVSAVGSTTASFDGSVLSDGGSSILDRGFCVSTFNNPTIDNAFVSVSVGSGGLGNFSAGVSGLNTSTLYYVRSYVLTSSGYFYGNELSFTTGSVIATIPILQGINISNITLSSADAQSTILSDGGVTLTGVGFCYSTTNPNPTTSDTTIGGSSFGGNLTASLTGLNSLTTYYIRAYAINSVGTGYSTITSFTTNTNIQAVLSSSLFAETSIDVSVQWTITLSQPASGYVIFPLVITNDNNTGTTTIGILFNEGQQVSDIVSGYSKLATQYTAYCNFYDVPIGYSGSNTASHVIPALSGSVPTISINVSSNNITSDGITADGIDLVDNGSAITAKGACWGLSANPTVSGSHTSDGSGTASFTSIINGLDCGTTYHLRMYATNSTGTGYSSDYQFTTTSLNQMQAIFFTRVNTVEGGNVYITSLASAEQACFDYKNRTVIAVSGQTFRLDDVVVGAQTWNPTLECVQNGATGYYLIGGSTMYVIHLQSGVIDYLSQCYP